MTSEKLSQKWWYRLLKVAYVGGYIAALLLIILISTDAWPNTYTDTYNSLIKCKNGNTYAAGVNGISITSDGGFILPSEEVDARKLCEYDIINDYLGTYATPPSKNYEIQTVSTNTGSWREVIKIFAIGVVISVLILEVARRVFLYILTGRKILNRKKNDA